jgi:hypothetical protein
MAKRLNAAGAKRFHGTANSSKIAFWTLSTEMYATQGSVFGQIDPVQGIQSQSSGGVILIKRSPSTSAAIVGPKRATTGLPSASAM